MWKSWEDVENDLLKYSQYSIAQREQCSVPNTILNYRKTIEKNAKTDLPSDLNENRTYVMSGRSKGVKDRLIKPGEPFEHHSLDDIELKKSIREVSGIGYRMEGEPKEPKEDSIVPNFEWTSDKPIYKTFTIANKCNCNSCKKPLKLKLNWN